MATPVTAPAEEIDRDAESATPSLRAHTGRLRTDGYAVMPSLFAFDEIAWLRHEAEIAAQRVPAQRAPADSAWSGEAPAGTVYGLHRSHAALRKLAAHPRLLDIARHVLGGPVQVYQSRLVHRQMTLGDETVWRRDFANWSATDGMKRPRALTIAVVLGDIGPHGLSFAAVRGSHRSPKLIDGDAAAAITAGTGAVLLLDPNVAYALSGGAARRSSTVFFVAYNLIGNEAGGDARGAIFADPDAPAAIAEPDDCLWPSALCAAG